MLSLTRPGDWVLDPFLGVGTSVASAVMRGRKGCGSEKMPEYAQLARDRARQAMQGTLPVRAMNTPVYDAAKAGKALTTVQWKSPDRTVPWSQINLVEDRCTVEWTAK